MNAINIQTNYTDKRHRKLANDHLNEFRKIVRKSLGTLDHSEETVFYSIPENVWQNIFETNFGNDIHYAKTHILNMPNTNKIKHKQNNKINELMKYIDNYHIAVNLLEKAIDRKIPILILTDTDNDGSFAQSIAYNLRHVLSEEENQNLYIEYARATENNKTRGFTSDLVFELFNRYNISDKDDCLIITADNGINSYSEQRKINALFPKATLLITDHHNPEKNLCIQENNNTYVFNPHYFLDKHCKKNIAQKRQEENKILSNGSYKENLVNEAKDFFNEYNISGATTLGLLVKTIINNRTPNLANLTLEQQIQYKSTIDKHNNLIRKIDTLSDISNMLDYVYTHPAHKPMNVKEIKKALELQGLLNIVNSMNSLILNTIDEQTLNKLQNRYEPSYSSEPLDIEKIISANRNAQSLNVISNLLLSDYLKFKKLSEEEQVEFIKEYGSNIPTIENRISSLINGTLGFDQFTFDSGNYNYIEQLRPIIFDLMVSDDKSVYEGELYKQMINVFEELKGCEKTLLHELRKINTMYIGFETNNISISLVDSDIQRVFNRKLLGKAFNKSNDGFLMLLDNANDTTISGSFRAIYDISDIFPTNDRKIIENQFDITIETPGHERAAGFIIRTNDKPFDDKIAQSIMNNIADTLDKNIAVIKEQQNNNFELHILSDLDSLGILSRINAQTRGMVAHFYKMTPLVQLNPATTVAINNSTGEQSSLIQIANENKFGWTPLTVKLSNRDGENGVVVIVPNAILNKLQANNFKDYIRLNYMADGAYIFESIIPENQVDLTLPQIAFEKNNKGVSAMQEFYEKQKQTGQFVEFLDNKALMDLPFFKYNANSEESFRLYESYVIERLKQSGKKFSSTLDVEAAGFGNAPMFNIGYITYFIDDNSGIKIPTKTMREQSVMILNTDEKFFCHNPEFIENLKQNKQILNYKEYLDIYDNNHTGIIPDSLKIRINHIDYVMNPFDENGIQYGYGKNVINSHPDFEKIYNEDIGKINSVFNQQIVAENVAFLIKPDYYVIPHTLEKLTNIDNDFVQQYGQDIGFVDDFLYQYFHNKQKQGGILYEAHNTKYDANILRLNLKKTSELFNNSNNIISDSMDIAKENQLFYFDSDILTFKGIKGLEEVYFYASENSSWGLKQMLLNQDDEAQVYDITGNNLLFKERNKTTNTYDYYLFNNVENTTIKLNMNFPTNDLTVDKVDALNDKFNLELDIDNLPESITIDLTDIFATATQDLFNKIQIEKVKMSGRGKNKVAEKITEWVNQDEYLVSSAIYKSLPLNKVKSNANGLGETLSIKNLIDWVIKDQHLATQYLDTSKYKNCEDIQDIMINFMHSYNFKSSVKTNVNQLFYNNGFEDLYKGVSIDRITEKGTVLYNTDGLKERNEQLDNFVKDFIQLNHEIAKIYDNRWIYKAVLQHYQPKLMTDLNNANYENIGYQTGFPSEIVKEVLNNAYAFQQAFKKEGCESVLLIEQHNNGVSHGNFAGDTVFEAVAVGLNAVDVLGSPKEAAYVSLNHADRFTMRLYGKKFTAENTAIDSMSFKQHTIYLQRDEQDRTFVAQKLIDKADSIFNSDEYKIINFKLNETILDNGKEIYAIPRANQLLNREQLDKDTQSLKRIMQLYQIAFDKSDTGLYSLYNDNQDELEDLKRDLQNRYIYIEFNESKKYMDDYQKAVVEALLPDTVDLTDLNNDERHQLLENRIIDLTKSAVYKNGTSQTKLSGIVRASQIEGVEKTIDYYLIRSLPNFLLNNSVKKREMNNDMKYLTDIIQNFSQLNNDELMNHFNQLKHPASKNLAQTVIEFKAIKNMNISELNTKFNIMDGSKISIKEHVLPILDKYELSNSILDKQLTVLALNSGLIQSKKFADVSNLDKVIDYVNKHGESGFNSYWNGIKINNATLFTNDFLDFNGSRIYRNSVSNYMHKYFSIIQLGGKSIHDAYVTGTKPLNLVNNQELNGIIHDLESQMSLPPEKVEIELILKESNEDKTNKKQSKKKTI